MATTLALSTVTANVCSNVSFFVLSIANAPYCCWTDDTVTFDGKYCSDVANNCCKYSVLLSTSVSAAALAATWKD